MGEFAPWLQTHTPWPLVYDFFSDFAGPLGWWVLWQFVVLFAGTRIGLRLAWMLGLAIYSNTLLKWVWAEPRPYWLADGPEALRATAGFGMPSGHAQGATALWAGLWTLFRGRALLLVALLFIVGTGLSRIFYGVHSTSQVLVGTALGAVIVAGVWLLLPHAERALRKLDSLARFAVGVAGVAVLAALGWWAYRLRADFVAAQEWQTRFAQAQQRLGETGEMGLVDAGALVLVGLLGGFALLAWACAHWQHRIARSLNARLLCVLSAVAVNVGLIALLRTLGSDVWVAGALLVLQPVLALWLPLRLFGEELRAQG